MIPVAVHVVHQGGVENISDAQIKSQIYALNNDYRRIPNTKGYASGVDMQLKFALASKDPAGNPASGITRVSSPLSDVYYAAADSTFFAGDSSLKTLAGWPRDRYMNVFIVSQIDNDNVLGYAFYPSTMGSSIWDSDSTYDGIVISHWYWGTMGTAWPGLDMGATGTHEVAHWLGLLHPWETEEDSLPDGCACTTCLTCADRVCDTPPTKDPNYGYPGRQNTCSIDSPDVPDQTRNYLDYVDDAHMDMFTAGQRTRVNYFMDNDPFRSKLYSDSNQMSTGTGKYGPLESEFHANRIVTCAGGQVSFSDYSMNTSTQWEWSFPGGSPSTSTDENPIITYNAAGSYDVTLIVSNNGSTDTSIRSSYIFVEDSVYTIPFSEDFEGSVFPPINWQLVDPDSGGTDNQTWNQSTTVGGFGLSSQSATLFFNLYRKYNQKDALILPPIDLNNMETAEMTFSVAYEPFDSLYWLDTLVISVSSDCGNSWTEVYRKGGEDLSTYITMGSFFIPDSNEWRIDTVNISAAAQSTASIKFETINKYGNNIYIDDITIDGVPLSVAEDPLNNSLNLYPNPVHDQLQIDLGNNYSGDVEIRFFDLTGRELHRITEIHNLGEGVLSIDMSKTGINSPGIYIVEISTSTLFVSKKLIVY